MDYVKYFSNLRFCTFGVIVLIGDSEECLYVKRSFVKRDEDYSKWYKQVIANADLIDISRSRMYGYETTWLCLVRRLSKMIWIDALKKQDM